MNHHPWDPIFQMREREILEPVDPIIEVLLQEMSRLSIREKQPHWHPLESNYEGRAQRD
jgi:hypothetical protein